MDSCGQLTTPEVVASRPFKDLSNKTPRVANGRQNPKKSRKHLQFLRKFHPPPTIVTFEDETILSSLCINAAKKIPPPPKRHQAPELKDIQSKENLLSKIKRVTKPIPRPQTTDNTSTASSSSIGKPSVSRVIRKQLEKDGNILEARYKSYDPSQEWDMLEDGRSKCRICQKEMKLKYKMYKFMHSLMHSGLSLFQCPFCEVKLGYAGSRREHIITQHSDKLKLLKSIDSELHAFLKSHYFTLRVFQLDSAKSKKSNGHQEMPSLVQVIKKKM